MIILIWIKKTSLQFESEQLEEHWFLIEKQSETNVLISNYQHWCSLAVHPSLLSAMRWWQLHTTVEVSIDIGQTVTQVGDVDGDRHKGDKQQGDDRNQQEPRSVKKAADKLTDVTVLTTVVTMMVMMSISVMKTTISRMVGILVYCFLSLVVCLADIIYK